MDYTMLENPCRKRWLRESLQGPQPTKKLSSGSWSHHSLGSVFLEVVKALLDTTETRKILVKTKQTRKQTKSINQPKKKKIQHTLVLSVALISSFFPEPEGKQMPRSVDCYVQKSGAHR